MKEELLHFLWKFQLFSTVNLKTTNNNSVQVVYPGTMNALEGPDFLHAKIRIDSQLWVGNVEIHGKASDWYIHQHEQDVNYNAVVLHVVWKEDAEIYGRDNQPIPTLELKDFVSRELLKRHEKLFSEKQTWIPCEHTIDKVDLSQINMWFESLYIQRLEKRNQQILEFLEKSNNHWESVLFQMLAKNFGLNINGDAFVSWSLSFPFSVLLKERFDVLKLEALFFGQAQLLEDSIENSYYQSLQKEYAYQKHKYNLTSLVNHSFQFFGMRPTNFPTIRIAQLAMVYYKNEHLFSRVLDLNSPSEAYELFEVELNDFWLTHYTFSKESPKRKKIISKAFIDLIIINTIVPIQFAYRKYQHKTDSDSFEIVRKLSPEKNSIIQKFKDIGVNANNAFETQSLLELKNNYCAKKRCLQCAIGLKLLRD